jgi:hypothetical protein
LYLRYVQKHGLITLPAGAWFQETGATTLDLHLATSLLLNVLHICTSLSNNLGSEIESRDRFQINRNPFFGPFTLYAISRLLRSEQVNESIHGRIRHAQLDLAHADGIVARQRDSVAPSA